MAVVGLMLLTTPLVAGVGATVSVYLVSTRKMQVIVPDAGSVTSMLSVLPMFWELHTQLVRAASAPMVEVSVTLWLGANVCMLVPELVPALRT